MLGEIQLSETTAWRFELGWGDQRWLSRSGQTPPGTAVGGRSQERAVEAPGQCTRPVAGEDQAVRVARQRTAE